MFEDMLDIGDQNIQKAEPEPWSSSTIYVYRSVLKRQHLTSAAGKSGLASGAGTITSTNLLFKKITGHNKLQKNPGSFFFHPAILVRLSQHADAVNQVAKRKGFRGLGQPHFAPSKGAEQYLLQTTASIAHTQ